MITGTQPTLGQTYGGATLAVPATHGVLVKLTGNDLVTPCTGATDKPFQILTDDYRNYQDARSSGWQANNLCTGQINGLGQTSNFIAANVTGGVQLGIDATTGFLCALPNGGTVVGKAIAVTGGVLHYQLLLTA